MKCIECGHELKDGAIFCIRCGAMQVSMDGKPIERSGDWPEVDAQSNSNYRSSTDGALHSAQSKNPRGFKPAPQRNGGRIAAIIVAIIALIAVIAFAVVMLTQPATSGSSEASSAATSASASTTSDSSTATSSTSSASTSSASASTSSQSASTASASASATSASADAAAAAAAAEAAAQQQQQQAAQPEPEPTYYYNDYYVLPESSYYYYSWDELSGMSSYDLYIARNEVYARHGRMFNRSDLQDYFNSQAWYEPLYTPAQWDSMGNQLSDAELSNVKLMKQVEESKGSPYL